MNHIKLRPLVDNDILLIKEWLQKPYIKKWYHDSEEWLDEISLRDSIYSFIKHRIVMINDIPIGFCQYYDCYYAQEEWYTVSQKNEYFSIDYLIGETEYLHKGYAPKIVKALIDEIKSTESFSNIIVQPEKDNLPSINTLLSAGLIFDEEKDYYIY